MRVLCGMGTLLWFCSAPLALADPFFLPKVDLQTAPGVQAVEIGDVTNDGIPDLVATHQYSESTTVYRGLGDGTFLPRVTSLNYQYSPRFKLGNFDADTLVDIALPGGDRIVVGHGDGQGHFGDFVWSYGSGPAYPGRIAMGFINADSYPDLVVANEYLDPNGKPDSVFVYLGNGDGTFQPKAFATPKGTAQVDLGDVTGDNALDIVVTTAYCCPDESHLAVLAGGGDGTFEPWVPVFLCAEFPNDVALGDINGDTKLDMVTSCYDQLCISVNNGSGVFSGFPSVPAKAGAGPSLVVGDLDRDGKADIARSVSDYLYSGPADDSVYVYKGNGDGTFQSPVPYDVSDTPLDLASGDLNGDGQIDLVTASPVVLEMPVPGYISVLMNCVPCATTAIAVALQEVRTEAGVVRLEWMVPDAGTSINSVQRRTIDSDWVELGQGTAGPRGTVTFEDHDVTAGTRYAYRLFVLSARDQGYSNEAWVTVPGTAPLALRLEPAYPNPFRAETRLTFTVPGNGRAALSIYDVRGRRVAKLLDEDMPPGGSSISWNGTDNSGHTMASGTYFAKLSAGGKSLVRKVLLAR